MRGGAPGFACLLLPAIVATYTSSIGFMMSGARKPLVSSKRGSRKGSSSFSRWLQHCIWEPRCPHSCLIGWHTDMLSISPGYFATQPSSIGLSVCNCLSASPAATVSAALGHSFGVAHKQKMPSNRPEGGLAVSLHSCQMSTTRKQ